MEVLCSAESFSALVYEHTTRKQTTFQSMMHCISSARQPHGEVSLAPAPLHIRPLLSRHTITAFDIWCQGGCARFNETAFSLKMQVPRTVYPSLEIDN